MTRAISAAVHGGGTGGGGSAVAAAAPKSIAPASAPRPIAPTAARRAGRAEGNILAPSSGDQVAVADDGWRQNKLSRKYRDFSCKTAVICGCDVDRGDKDLEMRDRRTS